MRYAWIEDHRATWPVAVQCDVLVVSRSGYYAWRRRSPSAAAERREKLTDEIRTAYAVGREAYGSPRVHRELLAQGTKCDRKTVATLMKQAGIQAKTVKKFRVSTTDSNHRQPIAENVVNRDFTAAAPNRTWVADITYVPTQEGWLYFAAVVDLYSRKVVGWSMSQRIDSRLVVDALQMAIERQLPGDGLVAHSDRGVQYASEHYRELLTRHGITCSMSRRGNCWDNAPMESFFATLKKELIHLENYETRAAARQSIFEYVEVFYNRVRRHSALNYLSPVNFELAA